MVGMFFVSVEQKYCNRNFGYGITDPDSCHWNVSSDKLGTINLSTHIFVNLWKHDYRIFARWKLYQNEVQKYVSWSLKKKYLKSQQIFDLWCSYLVNFPIDQHTSRFHPVDLPRCSCIRARPASFPPRSAVWLVARDLIHIGKDPRFDGKVHWFPVDLHVNQSIDARF